uniref:Zpr1 domain-containing protein n=1 Tax=Macrostomum lignano TaxID=282301 RepID=A0A1I8GCI3_9PLAT
MPASAPTSPALPSPSLHSPTPSVSSLSSRVSAELERLNLSAQQLNSAETDLTEARAEFRRRQSAGLEAMTAARVAAGPSCIEAARPAYEARRRCQLTQLEARAAAARFLRQASPTSSAEHQRLARRCHELEAAAARLERSVRASVARRAKPYFDACERQRRLLEEQKARVDTLEEKRRICKRVYQETMAALEAISEEVHSAQQPLFPGLDPDELQVTEMQSLCMNCHSQGVTKLLLTRIPYFKEVVVSSFDCPDCGHQSRSTDHAERIQDYGVEFKLRVSKPSDLNRKLVRAPGSEIRLPELDSVFPGSEASVSTVEGALTDVLDNLRSALASAATSAGPDGVDRLAAFINKMQGMIEAENPSFTLVLRDPSGNSFLENPSAPAADPCLTVRRFQRTREEDEALGITPADAEAGTNGNASSVVANGDADGAAAATGSASEEFDRYGEVLNFQVNCPNCSQPTESRMKLVRVPYFKEVVVMATTCEACGHKDSSVKCGGGIEPQGVRLELAVQEPFDLSRDVLVSDSCMICIPELEFETEQGSLGGKFTTVEGLLLAIRDSLAETNPCLLGDATETPRFGEFLARITALATVVEEPDATQPRFRLILDDPAGNSYVQNLCAPDPDPQLQCQKYDRSEEQNESLGLTDMKTENYAEPNS